MPWTNPGTATAGQVLTASRWNTDVRDNSLMGHPVFTNEAARDAVITAPVEGQMCYLTAPTVPAATGATTFLPSGIVTIYNGSVWVCVTPVGAVSSGNGNTTSSSFTATLGGSPGTNPSVTLVTGTTAKIEIAALLYGTTAGNVFMGVAVSGAGTVAATTTNSAYTATTQGIVSGRSVIIGGLTAGTNTFTLQYLAGAHTGNYQDRSLVVSGVV